MNFFKHWRLLDTGPGSGPENMATAGAVLENCIAGASPPALHFYTWAAPAVTLGHFQDIEKAVNIKGCRSHGAEVIRRLTGGRAVVHDKDLSYSLVFPAKGGQIPEGIGAGYRKIALGFIKGLHHLGAFAECSDGRQKQDFSVSQRRSVSACFLTRIRYEVLNDGRKLVGSAQRRMDQWVLQQGTVLVDLDRALWATLLRYPEGIKPQEVMRGLASEMTSIVEITGRQIDIDLVKKALLNGLSDELGVDFVSDRLSPDENVAKARLIKEKYRDLCPQVRLGRGRSNTQR